MSPYQNHFYWEHQLEHSFFEKDLSFHRKSNPQNALFIHASIVNYQASFVDYHWSCFTEPKKLLGYLQYVFLPSAFYHWLNPAEKEVKIPLDSSEGLIHFLQKFPSSHTTQISEDLGGLNSLWEFQSEELLTKLLHFSTQFNLLWCSTSLQLSFHIFTDTREIATYLKKLSPFPEVFSEDYGMSPQAFEQWCCEFYQNPMIHQTFLSMLQNRVGCIA